MMIVVGELVKNKHRVPSMDILDKGTRHDDTAVASGFLERHRAELGNTGFKTVHERQIYWWLIGVQKVAGIPDDFLRMKNCRADIFVQWIFSGKNELKSE